MVLPALHFFFMAALRGTENKKFPAEAEASAKNWKSAAVINEKEPGHPTIAGLQVGSAACSHRAKS